MVNSLICPLHGHFNRVEMRLLPHPLHALPAAAHLLSAVTLPQIRVVASGRYIGSMFTSNPNLHHILYGERV